MSFSKLFLFLIIFYSFFVFSEEKSELEKARELNKEATELFNNKKYLPAILKLESAYKIYPKEEILFNIAFIYEKMGRDIDAFTYYKKYLKRTPIDAEKVEECIKKLKIIETRLLKKMAFVKIFPSVKDAKIFVDGKEIKFYDLGFFLPPGTYKLLVEKEGYKKYESEISLEKGESASFEAFLEPLPIPATLIVTVFPEGSKIIFDKKEIGVSPLAGDIKGISAGTYNLRIEKEGYVAYEENINFTEGEIKNLFITLKKIEEEKVNERLKKE